MSAVPPRPAPPPADARRAALRARDALTAATARAGVRLGAAGAPVVEVAEAEIGLPVAGLARALAEAVARPGARLVPGGGFAGAAFPAAETYVASWELRMLDRRRAAAAAITAPAPPGAPVTLRGCASDGVSEAFSPWLVHSFAGRKRLARPEVLALVPASARHVLDVGCGEGALGASIKARGARVTGIELDRRAAEAAAGRLTRVLALPAEEAVGVLDSRPDVVILADVIEHLTQPVAVLRTLRAALARGGVLVFSLPNATHAAVLGGAFRGRWDRELEGIVADDHRTYAGRQGWTALLTACGFRVTSLVAAAARTPLSDGDRTALLGATGLAAEDVDTVQWLGTAEVAGPATAVDAPCAVAEDGPLAAEDVISAVGAVARDGLPVAVRNPVRVGLLETLLRGGLVTGGDAAGLLSGWTPQGLADRFEGSGMVPRVAPASPEPPSPLVQASVAARRAAGLPTDEPALAASSWVVTFVPGATPNEPASLR